MLNLYPKPPPPSSITDVSTPLLKSHLPGIPIQPSNNSKSSTPIFHVKITKTLLTSTLSALWKVIVGQARPATFDISSAIALRTSTPKISTHASSRRSSRKRQSRIGWIRVNTARNLYAARLPPILPANANPPRRASTSLRPLSHRNECLTSGRALPTSSLFRLEISYLMRRLDNFSCWYQKSYMIMMYQSSTPP